MLKFLHSWCTYSPLYGLALRGSVRGQIRSVVQDNWPGLPGNTRSLSVGLYKVGSVSISVAEILQTLATPKADAITVSLHTFDFLRDLYTIGDNNSRRLARQAINQWIDNNNNWNTKPWRCHSWNLDILGYRLCNWLGFYEFVALSADNTFKKKVIISIGQQYRHLKRCYSTLKDPLSAFRALKGLIYAGCALPREQNQLGKWVAQLQKYLKEQLDVKYNHYLRHPGTLILLIRDLIDLRQILRHFYAGSIDFLTETITRLAPVVRHFRHGDGELSNFTGIGNSRLIAFCDPVLSKSLIDMVLSLADSKLLLPEQISMGYARCISRGGLLITNLQSLNTYPKMSEWLGQSTGIGEFEWSERSDRLIMRGDISIYAQDSDRLIVSTQINDPIRYDIVHEQDYGFVSAVYRIDQQNELRDPEAAVMRAKRELCISPVGDLRGEDTVKISQNSQLFVRFLAAPGLFWKIMSDGLSAYLCRLPSDNRPMKNEDHVKKLICSGIDQIFIAEVENHQALCLRANIQANAKYTIKWSLSPL